MAARARRLDRLRKTIREAQETSERLEDIAGAGPEERVIINICLGLVTAGLTALLGLPNPFLWGAIAGLLNFIPYLGGAVTTGILTLVSFFTFETWLRIVSPPLAFALINGLEGYLITPMIIGNRLTMNPIFVFTAAKGLGNTPAICRTYYVHPDIIRAYAQGTLFAAMARADGETGSDPGDLAPEETAVIELLQEARDT